MSNLVNALNGGKVALFVLDGSEWSFIGGQTAHSKSLTLEPIDISNKALPEDRCYLEGEGRKLAEVTAEILWNTDAAYQFMRSKADSKEFVDIQVRYADDLSRVDQFKVLVTSVSTPVEQNTAVTSSITLSNTSDFNIDLSYEALHVTTDGPLLTSNGEPIFVRT